MAVRAIAFGERHVLGWDRRHMLAAASPAKAIRQKEDNFVVRKANPIRHLPIRGQVSESR